MRLLSRASSPGTRGAASRIGPGSRQPCRQGNAGAASRWSPDTVRASRASRRALLLGLHASALAGCLSFHQGPLPGEPQATYLEVDGVRVRYQEVGQGPAVLMLHGYASSLETWDTVVPALAGRHRLIRLDLKGFGWTDRPEGDYSPAAQAALVLKLMDQLAVPRAALVAHSWGSSVALQLALAAPERVARLALYDAFVYDEQLTPFFRWSQAPVLGELLFGLWYDARQEDRLALAFYRPDAIPQELVDAVELALQRPGTFAAALATARGMRYDRDALDYGKVGAPTLLLWGREDSTAKVAVGERLARQLPDARLLVYPRCGHLAMLEAPESTRDLAAFLAEGGSW